MNNRYNTYDLIKNSIPKEPLLRFRGESKEDFEKWYGDTKNVLLKLLGFDKMKKAVTNEIFVEKKEFENYTREKYAISTLENMEMPFYVLKSKKIDNHKAAIAIHGHGSDGKEGLVGNEAESYKESIGKFSYTYAFELMEKGYTVYVPDIPGSGERTLGIYEDNRAECNDINNALMSLGMCLQGVILFENMCLAEYIYSKGYAEIDCVGFSGGGHSALWLGVMCDKIKKIVVSGFMHSFKDVILYTNRCGCNFVPHLWEYVDMGDILAMGAYKDIYIETGDEDKLNGVRGVEGVREQVDIAKRCFELWGKDIDVNVCHGGHKWFGSCMDRF